MEYTMVQYIINMLKKFIYLLSVGCFGFEISLKHHFT